MQARSGCKVQIQKEHELEPGQTDRIITLQAVKQESIDECRGIIEGMVQDRVQAAGGSSNNRSSFKSGGGDNGGNYYGSGGAGIGAGGGGGGGGNSGGRTDNTETKVQEALAEGHKLVKVEVPDADVGLIIGKGGATIKQIQSSTGSCVQIPKAANADNASVRTISITCPTQEGAEAAKTQVVNIIQNKITNNNNHSGQGNNSNYNNMQSTGPPAASVQVAVPNKDVGLCIGRQGCVIRQLQGKTNTKIDIPPQPVGNVRVITVTGPSQEACELAKTYIERIINEQSTSSIMPGSYQNNNNQSYQQRPVGGPGVGGGHHYQNQHRNNNNNNNNNSGMYGNQNSAQSNDPAWQAYHAAQALANKQQQEQQQAAYVAASAASAAPASDAYYEQFHRYAYYYGEEAARQYYGTWSPPIGTPNPYGINPAGITAAPAASESGAPPNGTATMAQAQAQPAVSANNIEVRDSSVRKVSNLPAWMTKS